jgi:hypothetical protein
VVSPTLSAITTPPDCSTSRAVRINYDGAAWAGYLKVISGSNPARRSGGASSWTTVTIPSWTTYCRPESPCTSDTLEGAFSETRRSGAAHSPARPVRDSNQSTLIRAVESSVPIRLTQTPPRCGMRPRAGIEVGIGRRLNTARDAEQRAERVERVETPVEAECELIEVGL